MAGAGGKTGSTSNYSTQQKAFIEQMLKDLGPDAMGLLKDALGPYDPAKYESVFQKVVVDPAMQDYSQRVVPTIQQRYVDQGAGRGSALNLALADSANDLTTQLGAQYGNFFQGQQDRQMQALQAMLGQSMTPTKIPTQTQGWLGPLLGAGAQVAGAYYGRPQINYGPGMR